MLAGMRAALRRRGRTATGQGKVVALDNVERVRCLDPAALDQRYLRQGRPVILTDLFDDAPVRQLVHVATAKKALAGVILPIGPNPVHAAVLGRDAPERRRARFPVLYDRFSAGRAQRMICAEHDLPEQLADLMPVPPHLSLGHREDLSHANVFFSGAGNATHLHYDKDLRHDLIYHVLGRKRYVLIDPSETHKLAAGAAPGAPYASTLFLDRFSPGELLAFIRSTNAWDCVVEPGETLVLPATVWHYVAYVDTALSVHFRMARNHFLLRLADMATEAHVGSPDLQALATAFLDESRVEPRAARALDALEAVISRHCHDPWGLAGAFARQCAEHCENLHLPVARRPHDLASITRRASSGI